MTLRCASTFLRNDCQHPAGHDGNHCHRDSSGHTTAWDDAAADPSTLLAAKQSETAHLHRTAPPTPSYSTCAYAGKGFCAASVDGYCVGGWADPDDGELRCHG